ncbi:MAG: hypothetical protein QNK37_32350 [Acidobacteriota bacterium]|nr:hypothetical protein [Acidobacteriota bacterium]
MDRNPYVGPRAYSYGEKLYGRSSEVRRLSDLLIAERIVLLYSPSGAGKSSLIQAALCPELEGDDFAVLGPIRVNQLPPPEFPLSNIANRYIFSLLLSLEEQQTAEDQIPLDRLAGMDLADYLRRRREGMDEMLSPLLIFDQFEEILTLDPLDHPGRTVFFEQVGAVLKDRNIWALFTMREDYLAGLDPYLRAVPTRLSIHFRLNLLRTEQAMQAVLGPACDAGVTFSREAAETLTTNLCRTRVQAIDGSMQILPGLHVEPVQLQVVCHRLWQGLDAGTEAIDSTYLEEIGDVDQALAHFYAASVTAVAKETGIPERDIREWCDQRLITDTGLRGQVLLGEEQSQGLANNAVMGLVNAHIVRAERRRGATWFELSHDRLVAPIRKDNEAWRNANLSLLQLQAMAWARESRADAYLLRDAAFLEADRWAEEHPGEVGALEEEFLKRCRDAYRAQTAHLEAARSRRNRKIAVVAAGISLTLMIALLIVLLLYKSAEEKETRAEEALEVALLRKAEAEEQKRQADIDFARAREDKDKAVTAREQAEQKLAEAITDADRIRQQAQRDVAAAERRMSRVKRESDQIKQDAETKEERANQRVAQAEFREREAEKRADDARRKTDAALQKQQQAVTRSNELLRDALVVDLAARAGQKARTSATEAARLALWAYSLNLMIRNQEHLPAVHNALRLAFRALLGNVWMSGRSEPVRVLLARGDHLYVGGDNGGLIMYRNDVPAAEWSFREPVRDLLPTADGLVVRTLTGLYHIEGKQRPQSYGLRRAEGEILISAATDGAYLYPVWEGGRVEMLQLRSFGTRAEPFWTNPDMRLPTVLSPDLKLRAAALGEGIGVWAVDRQTSAQPNIPLVLPESDVLTALAFDPTGKRLAAGTISGSIHIFSLETRELQVVETPHRNRINALAFSSDGGALASAGGDGTIRLYRPGRPSLLIGEHEGWAWCVAFAPGDEMLYTGGADHRVFRRHTVTANLARGICGQLKDDPLPEETFQDLTRGLEIGMTYEETIREIGNTCRTLSRNTGDPQ